MTQAQLEIKASLCNEVVLHIAREELRRMDSFRAPSDKVECVVRCASVIFSVLNLARTLGVACAIYIYIYIYCKTSLEKESANERALWQARAENSSQKGQSESRAGADDFLPFLSVLLVSESGLSIERDWCLGREVQSRASSGKTKDHVRPSRWNSPLYVAESNAGNVPEILELRNANERHRGEGGGRPIFIYVVLRADAPRILSNCTQTRVLSWSCPKSPPDIPIINEGQRVLSLRCLF